MTSEESSLPITKSLKQFIYTDIFDIFNKMNKQVDNNYQPDINSFENVLGEYIYSTVISGIFSGLSSLVGDVSNERIAKIAIAVLISDNISNQVAEILAKNLATSANIFIDNFDDGIKEKKEELIREFNDLLNNITESIGSNIGRILSNILAAIPPISALNAASLAVKTGADTINRILDDTKEMQDTAERVINRTIKEFYDKYDISGIPEMVQLGKVMHEILNCDINELLNKPDLDKFLQNKINAQLNKGAAKFNEALEEKVKKTTRKAAQNAVRNVDEATRITPSAPPATRKSIMIGGKKKSGSKKYFKNNKLNSILKTAKRKRKNNKNNNTKRVRFV